MSHRITLALAVAALLCALISAGTLGMAIERGTKGDGSITARLFCTLLWTAITLALAGGA